MKHTVEIIARKKKELEEYWLLRAILDDGTHKAVIKEKKFEYEPSLSHIGAFLAESGASFVSVEHNYRWSDMELPFE